jgi:hypothetical protein
MLGGVSFAHTQWTVTGVPNVTTATNRLNFQGSEHAGHTVRTRQLDVTDTDNVDRVSAAERYVLCSACRHDSGS